MKTVTLANQEHVSETMGTFSLDFIFSLFQCLGSYTYQEQVLMHMNIFQPLFQASVGSYTNNAWKVNDWHWRRSGVFIVNFERISHFVLVFLHFEHVFADWGNRLIWNYKPLKLVTSKINNCCAQTQVWAMLITNKELRSRIQRLMPKILWISLGKKKSKLSRQKGLMAAPFHR